MWLEIVTALLTIVYLVYKFAFSEDKEWKKSSSQQIPGLDPSDPVLGNKKDIEKAGTMSEFLANLHEKYGPIARFYEGKRMSVSITSPDMFKQIRHLYTSPTDHYEQFKLLTGPENMTFCDVDEIKRRRKVYDHHFMMGACKKYSENFVDISKDLVEKIANENEAIPLMKTMSGYSIASLLRCCFGEVLKDRKILDEYQELVDWVFRHFDPPPKEGTEVYDSMVEKCITIRTMIQKLIEYRRKMNRSEDDPEMFIDVLANFDISEEARTADVTVFISSGYFAVAAFLTWFLYEMARHPEIQNKIHEEIASKLGNEPMTVDNMAKLTYLRQAIDETLRVYLCTGFTARIAETDLELGSYHVPKGSVVYQSCRVFTDPNFWEDPEKFDPSRFDREHSRGRDPYTFKPFGFAGKRVCPGMNFAYSEISVFASELLRRCKIHLVPGQDVKKVPGFVIAPVKEIMVTLEKRN